MLVVKSDQTKVITAWAEGCLFTAVWVKYFFFPFWGGGSTRWWTLSMTGGRCSGGRLCQWTLIDTDKGSEGQCSENAGPWPSLSYKRKCCFPLGCYQMHTPQERWCHCTATHQQKHAQYSKIHSIASEEDWSMCSEFDFGLKATSLNKGDLIPVTLHILLSITSSSVCYP